MAKANFKLQDFNDMFKRSDKTEEEKKTAETPEISDIVTATPKKQEPPKLPLHSLRKYKDHPFKAYTGDKLNELVESIKEHGILTPILVRPLSDQLDVYEIIAGHNRANAAKIAGLDVVPAVIRAMDDDTAAILMVESNFQQRQDISPSEKAFAYKIQLEALKRQGKRTDLTDGGTSPQLVGKLESTGVVGKEAGISGETVRRYIRLTELSPALLQSVDDNKIPFIPAVNISYLRENEQQALHEILSDKNIKLSLAKSEVLKNTSAEQELDRNAILDILEEEKPKPTTIKAIKVPFKGVAEYFKGKSLTEKEMSDIWWCVKK